MQKNPLNESFFEKHQSLVTTTGFIILLIAALAGKAYIGLFPFGGANARASDLTIESILKAVNEQRGLRNLVTLNTNSKLSLAAQSKSDDMQARHYFAHVDPDGHYIWDKIVAAGYSPYLQLGENLAIEFYDTDSLVSAWMNSPTHRENILQDGFRDQGMGLAFGDSSLGQYHSAITNTFGALLITAPKTSVTPAPKPTTKPTVKKSVPIKKTTTPPKTLGTEAVAPSPAPAPIPAPTPQPLENPIQPREGQPLALNPDMNFTLPQKIVVPDQTSTPTPPLTSTSQRLPKEAVIGNPDLTETTNRDINRYLILFSGVALLLLMMADIRKAVSKKLGSIDKKINNFVILLMSLIVIGFIYWL